MTGVQCNQIQHMLAQPELCSANGQEQGKLSSMLGKRARTCATVWEHDSTVVLKYVLLSGNVTFDLEANNHPAPGCNADH